MYRRPQQVMVLRPEGWCVAAFHNLILIIHPYFLADAMAWIEPKA